MNELMNESLINHVVVVADGVMVSLQQHLTQKSTRVNESESFGFRVHAKAMPELVTYSHRSGLTQSRFSDLSMPACHVQ